MRQQNSYRVINEDIVALRNIAWAITKDNPYNDIAHSVYSATELLLLSSEDRDTDIAISIFNFLTIN